MSRARWASRIARPVRTRWTAILSGVIPPAEQVPPGEDQVHLLGGDPGESINSQTGNPAYADARFAPKSEKDVKAKDDPNLPHASSKPSPATPHPASQTLKQNGRRD